MWSRYLFHWWTSLLRSNWLWKACIEAGWHSLTCVRPVLTPGGGVGTGLCGWVGSGTSQTHSTTRQSRDAKRWFRLHVLYQTPLTHITSKWNPHDIYQFPCNTNDDKSRIEHSALWGRTLPRQTSAYLAYSKNSRESAPRAPHCVLDIAMFAVVCAFSMQMLWPKFTKSWKMAFLAH